MVWIFGSEQPCKKSPRSQSETFLVRDPLPMSNGAEVHHYGTYIPSIVTFKQLRAPKGPFY